jgi:hypothetical protein
MAVSADPTQLYLGRGKLYFDRFDASGVPTGLRFLGEADKLEINPSTTVKEYFTMTKAAATKLAQNITNQSHEIDIQLREYHSENLALALLGDKITLTQSSATITGELLSSKAIPGYVYQTANRKVSAPTGHTGATALVLGTDYEILDAEMGLIRVLPGTTQLDGTKPFTLDYTAAAITTGIQIQAGTESKIEGKLVFVGDPANGPAIDAEIWRVRMQPSGALALITDDYSMIPLKGEVMDDSTNHPNQPLYRVTRRS